MPLAQSLKDYYCYQIKVLQAMVANLPVEKRKKGTNNVDYTLNDPTHILDFDIYHYRIRQSNHAKKRLKRALQQVNAFRKKKQNLE